MFTTFPSCQFQATHPQTAAEIRDYLKGRWNAETTGCCRREGLKFQSGDTLVTVCLSCTAILRERFPSCSVITLYDLLEQDCEFCWPDARQQAITVQDCARADASLRRQVRGLLTRMNYAVHEMDEAAPPTCGTLLMNPISDQNRQSAPAYFKSLQAQVKILDSAKQQKLLQAQAGYYPDKQVVAYCNSCYQALGSLNIERFHLLDLIFMKG